MAIKPKKSDKRCRPIYDRPLLVEVINNTQNHLLLANQNLAYLKRSLRYSYPSQILGKRPKCLNIRRTDKTGRGCKI